YLGFNVQEPLYRVRQVGGTGRYGFLSAGSTVQVRCHDRNRLSRPVTNGVGGGKAEINTVGVAYGKLITVYGEFYTAVRGSKLHILQHVVRIGQGNSCAFHVIFRC